MSAAGEAKAGTARRCAIAAADTPKQRRFVIVIEAAAA
jgi:hypothetical protein